MPLADLSYKNSDIAYRLKSFDRRFQKVVQLYQQCAPCKHKAAQMGVSMAEAPAVGSNDEEFNTLDKLLDLQIECKQVLYEFDDVKKELQRIAVNIENRIAEERQKWQQ